LDSNIKSQRDYLLASPAFKSLNTEVELSEFIQSMGWRTVQGAYYKDSVTEKFRELDIFARRLWESNLDKDLLINICCLAEVKSASDFNVVFSDFNNYYDNHFLLNSFIGYDYPEIGNAKNYKKRVDSILKKRGIDSFFTKKVFQEVEDNIFPNSVSIFADLPRIAPSINNVSCSFREFNGKNEKELDNSVLWRANQALISAATAENEEKYFNKLSDLETNIDFCILNQLPLHETLVSEITRGAKRISLLHPVVITDSNLWLAGHNDVEPLKYCRFVQNNFYGHTKWWIDVVNYNHYKEYFQLMTKSYEFDFSQKMKERNL
jgi:hypothetical protein